ncbi:MAG: hypothetical protein ACOVP1_01875 [Bacteroidia bacterium]
MGNVIRLIFFYLNAISADIVIAAVCLFFTLNELMGIETKIYLSVLLIFGTFIVYWFDHYIDIQIYGKNISPRHFFFSKYQTVFLIVSLVFLTIGSIICLYALSWSELIHGLLLGTLMLIYLFLHKKLNRFLFFKKEFLISLLYATSVSFQAFAQMNLGFIWYYIPLLLTVFYAVNSIASIEKSNDEVLGIINNQKINQTATKDFLKRWLLPILTCVPILITDSIPSQFFFASLLSIQLIHLILLKKHKLGTLNLLSYRIISEWSFCLPILVYFIKKAC